MILRTNLAKRKSTVVMTKTETDRLRDAEYLLSTLATMLSTNELADNAEIKAMQSAAGVLEQAAKEYGTEGKGSKPEPDEDEA